MNLEHPHLGEADEAALVLYIEVLATGFLLLDHHGLEVLRDAGARVLLEEASLALPLGAAEETQRPLDDVGQDPVADPVVELREVTLGQSLLGVEDSVGVAEPYPRDDIRTALG